MNKFRLRNSLRPLLVGHWAAGFALAVAIFATWIALRYAGQPLLEMHPFRQTQTALTSLWMMKEGWQLAYQTPVGGYPWSIPFEFPIFQSLAALIASWGAYSLDPVGRLLSFFFLIACAWPAFSIARRLDLPSDVAWVFCALLWSSPVYLFWGRTFMIETAATFFILAAIPFALDLRASRPSWRSVWLFALLATIAMLQKVTTAAPVIVILALILLSSHFTTSGWRMPPSRQLVCAAVAFAIPVIVVALWTNYTDLVKEQNPFGAALTSESLIRWNFGTIEQRLDFGRLKILLWDRVLSNNAAGPLGIFLLGGVLIFGSRRDKKIVFACLALFAFPILVFTNLHFVHLYYPTSSVVFLLGALAVALVQWLPETYARGRIIPIVISLLVVSNLLDLEISRLLFFDVVLENTQTGLLWLCFLLGAVLVFANNRVKKLILASLLFPLLLIMVFTNLQHAYGSTQIISFYFLAAALAVAGLCAYRKIVQSAFAPIVILLLVLGNLYHFSNGYAHRLWDLEAGNHPIVLSISDAIRDHTTEDSGIIVFGFGWSSEIAYYSQRKSFTVPDWFNKFDEVWREPELFLGDKKLGAIVFCLPSEKFSIATIIEQINVKRQPRLLKLGDCYLWFPKPVQL